MNAGIWLGLISIVFAVATVLFLALIIKAFINGTSERLGGYFTVFFVCFALFLGFCETGRVAREEAREPYVICSSCNEKIYTPFCGYCGKAMTSTAGKITAAGAKSVSKSGYRPLESSPEEFEGLKMFVAILIVALALFIFLPTGHHVLKILREIRDENWKKEILEKDREERQRIRSSHNKESL